MCKRPKFQFLLRILIPGAPLCLHDHLRACDMLGDYFILHWTAKVLEFARLFRSQLQQALPDSAHKLEPQHQISQPTSFESLPR